ncbi:hypothetical protein MUK42_27506 [Musa troglodytarum]|uniref:AAA+ ATPase domain-containing protein n=1 Tax=Musa troglodytarum TaxID=320322 RepID=A0A9E7F4F0_9LILI|nr:hypothetical protein MUK42_27506 [Musa troglodytarum]
MAMAAAPGSSKCLLVTGPPGVGKTTLITRVLEALRTSHPHLTVQGFYTREVREGAARGGFEVVTLDGRRGPLASSKLRLGLIEAGSLPVDDDVLVVRVFSENGGEEGLESFRWPTVGKYKVDVASFESLALPQLQIKEGIDLFIVDEVGKMELYSSSFFPAVLRVLDSNIPFLATIPVPKFGRDIPGVARLRNHPGATVFTLNPGNRDAMKDTIYSQIVNLLRNH